jgi:hypothetical protein
MAPLALVQLAVAPVSRVVLLLRRGPRMKLLYDFSAILFVGGALTGARSAGWSAHAAIALYSVAQIGAYGIFYAVMLHLLREVRGVFPTPILPGVE